MVGSQTGVEEQERESERGVEWYVEQMCKYTRTEKRVCVLLLALDVANNCMKILK